MPNYIWIVAIAILTTSVCFGINWSEAIAQQSNDNSSNVVSNNSLSASILTSDAMTLPQIFNKTENSAVQITSTSPISNSLVIRNGEQIPQNVALGSGFVYDQDGHILTNYHVISDPNSVEVTFVDGDSYSAKVIGQDPYSDIAVLQITDDGFQKQFRQYAKFLSLTSRGTSYSNW